MLNQPVTEVDKPPQFRIWHLIFATAIVAVVIMIAAPFLRQFNHNQWTALAAGALGASLSAAFCLILFAFPRSQSRKKGGPILLDLAGKASRALSSQLRIFSLISLLANTIIFFYYVASLGSDNGRPLPILELLALAGITAAAIFLSFIALIYSVSPQLRKNGLLSRAVLTPWNGIQTCRWSTLDPSVLRIGGFRVDEIPIEPEKREQVEAILRTHLTGFIQSTETSVAKD